MNNKFGNKIIPEPQEKMIPEPEGKVIPKPDERIIPIPDENGFASIPLDQTFAKTNGYRSFKILYDETFLKMTLASLNQLEYYDRIISLITRMDLYLSSFFKTTAPKVPKITVEKGFKDCENPNKIKYFKIEHKYFTQSYTVEGDILVYLYAMYNTKVDTIGSSRVCTYHEESKAPAIASIRLNIPYLFSKEKFSEVGQLESLKTLIHEFIHIFGFDDKNAEYLKTVMDHQTASYPNLAKLDITKLSKKTYSIGVLLF